MRAGRIAACLRAAGLAVAAFGCGACSAEYLARRDTLTPGSGDAVQANAAVHVIDPWPRVAARVDPDVSGERLQHAIERYRNPSSGSNAGAGSAVPVGASVTPGPSAAPVFR